jgi:hypothetical protein
VTDDAPTTAGIPDIGVATGTTDYVLSLPNYFQSDETASTNLAYSIVNNTNPSIFNSLTIDSQGNLTMDFAGNADGVSTLTIRATDPAGLLVDTTAAVHVNTPPAIGGFTAVQGSSDYWTLSGTVSDSDVAVAGDVVAFGGTLAGYNLTATVNADGTFTVDAPLPGFQGGLATAQTQDPYGVPSNQTSYLIATPPPAVAAVVVGSDQWSASFVSYLQSAGLGNGGYAIPVGSTSQLNTLPWNNLDQISITSPRMSRFCRPICR